MRLIDADALLDKFEWKLDSQLYIRVIRTMIGEAPTIDAVPVIRCEGCKWWTKQEDSLQGRCALHGMYPTGKWFCANARRKEE